ncbi:MAG: PilZ domain-containing protein [Candidatus Omnitrophica bacterium]|nr:PilZ domain-containing protein [Candidatus Omnitrophota bacterium]
MIDTTYERRAYKRINKGFSAILQPEQLGGFQDMITLRDLSCGGASFFSSSKLAQGAIANMKITLIPNKPSVECRARVLRSGVERSRELFPTAVQFIDIDAAQKSRIEDLIESLS